MSAPAVTVVVPNFNYGHFITEALASVIAQTWTDWEVIVVDDNSTDDSRDLVARCIRSNPDRQIRLIHHAQGPSGTPTPVNIGIRHMRGEYFAWLSSDDAFEPTKLERQLAEFRAQPTLGLVHTGYTRIDECGRKTGAFHPPTEFDADAFTALLDGNFINGNTVLIPRRVLEEVGPLLEADTECPDLWRSAEYYYWLQLSSRYPVLAIDEPLHRSRIHAGNRDINLGTTFPALERIFIRRFFEQESIEPTPDMIRAFGARGLIGLAVHCAQRLAPERREHALELLRRLERGQDAWDLGRYEEVRDLDRDRLRSAFRGADTARMLEAVARLERRDLMPYRSAARRRLSMAA